MKKNEPRFTMIFIICGSLRKEFRLRRNDHSKSPGTCESRIGFMVV